MEEKVWDYQQTIDIKISKCKDITIKNTQIIVHKEKKSSLWNYENHLYRYKKLIAMPKRTYWTLKILTQMKSEKEEQNNKNKRGKWKQIGKSIDLNTSVSRITSNTN